jgi:hypothetical protein
VSPGAAVVVGLTPVVRFSAVFSKKKPASATVTVWASWKSAVPTVPFVNVRRYGTRAGLLLSPLNHWVAPATLVKAAPFCVLASSSAW